jgi:coproporphyrinogen III oxidase
VNFSHVPGAKLPPSAAAHRPISAANRGAMGVSLVLHPRNPYAPTVHMNVRFFSTTNAAGEPVWWFGGGMDLTPYYGNQDDASTSTDLPRRWRRSARTCTRFKKWCDEYFYLKHRRKRAASAASSSTITTPAVSSKLRHDAKRGRRLPQGLPADPGARKDTPYGERERDFQAYRRGRYVEFNLVFDRGTLFGLQSGGRTEAILMSMPPIVKWRYRWNRSRLAGSGAVHRLPAAPRLARCVTMAYRIALLGGSYDPVHRSCRAGRILRQPAAGRPVARDPDRTAVAKSTLKASPQQRADMVALAFAAAVQRGGRPAGNRAGGAPADLHNRYAAQCARRTGAASAS